MRGILNKIGAVIPKLLAIVLPTRRVQYTRVGPYYIDIHQGKDESLGELIARVMRIEKQLAAIPGSEIVTKKYPRLRMLLVYVPYKHVSAMLRVAKKVSDSSS